MLNPNTRRNPHNKWSLKISAYLNYGANFDFVLTNLAFSEYALTVLRSHVPQAHFPTGGDEDDNLGISNVYCSLN